MMPSGRLVVTRDNAKSIRSMRAMFITPWYTAPELVIGCGSVGRTVASEVPDAMFLVRRNLARDWEPAINARNQLSGGYSDLLS